MYNPMVWIVLLNAVGKYPVGKTLRVDSTSAAVLVRRGDAAFTDDPGTPTVDESLGLVLEVNGKRGVVSLTKADVGLGNVDNTADSAKPIPAAVTAALATKLSEADANTRYATTSQGALADTAVQPDALPAAIAEGIANDGTVASAAASAAESAVEVAVGDLDLVTGSDERVPLLLEGASIDGDDGAYSIIYVDSEGRTGPTYTDVGDYGDTFKTTVARAALPVVGSEGMPAVVYIDSEGRTSDASEVREDGSPTVAAATALSKDFPGSSLRIESLIHEWWIQDCYTWLADQNRLVATVYGTLDGSVRAIEWRPGLGVTVNVVVDTAMGNDGIVTDDHNAPGHWVAIGRRGVMVWQRHSADNVLRVAVSGVDDVASFADSAITEIEIADEVSYGSPIHIAALSDEAQDTFWVPVRTSAGVAWRIQEISVAQSDGAVAVGDTYHFLQSSGGQFYCSFALDEGVVRIAAYHNPAQADNHIWYVEIDTATLDVSSPVHSSGEAFMNLGTAEADFQVNGSQVSPALTPVMAHNGSVDRRMFYVSAGPYVPRIAYAEWVSGSPDAATYKVWDVEKATSVDITTAGPRFGYTGEANYLCGMAFDAPAVDDTVYVARNLSPGGVIERHWTSRDGAASKTLVTSSVRPLIRPLTAAGRGPHLYFFEVASYEPFLAVGELRSAPTR